MKIKSYLKLTPYNLVIKVSFEENTRNRISNLNVDRYIL